MDNKDINDLHKKLQEIERLSAKFQLNINTTNLKDVANNAGAINSIFEDLLKKEQALGEETEHLVSNFYLLTQHLKQTTSGIQNSNKALKGLAGIAEQLTSHQKGYNDLSSKDLYYLQQKLKVETDRLKTSKSTLDREIENLLIQKQQALATGENEKKIKSIQEKLDKAKISWNNISNLLKNENNNLTELNNQLSDTIDKTKTVEKQLGLTGYTLKALSKIPIIGDAVDTRKALDAARESIDKGNGSFGAMKAALKSIGPDVKNVLTDPLVVVSFLGKQIFDTFTSLDKGIGEFAKGMNLTYQESAKLDSKFNNIANSSKSISVTTKGIRETMMAMGQSLGSNAILNEKDSVTFTKLREQAGLTNDELVNMQKLTLATGGNLKDNVNNMLFAAKTTALNNGVLLNEKQIMQEVSKASAATKLSLDGNPEALAKAAAQAKSLGMSLEQVSGIANKMLEIESSISNELEAELLTGKNLNLEQARLYALNNDMEGLSKEIAKNFGTAAEFSKMNRIQQEAAAKAVGMSREELAATLTDQEALKGLSGKQAEDAKAALALARERGMSEKEIKEKGIDGLMQQQSVQEKLLQTVEKLKEVFVSLLEPLMPIFDIFTKILSPVASLVGYLGKLAPYILAAVGAMKLFSAVSKKGLMTSIGEAAMKVISSLASIPIVGWGLGLAAAATVGALGSKYMTGDDIVSPGYGKRTLHGPEGAIALNDKDTVIAGTNLFDQKGDDVISAPGKSTKTAGAGDITTNSNIDVNTLVAELKSIKDVLNQIKDKEGHVYMDSTKLGTAINMGTSKIQ